MVGVYASQEQIQQQKNKNDYLYTVGDMNARLGNQPVDNVIGINGEHIGHYFIDLAI